MKFQLLVNVEVVKISGKLRISTQQLVIYPVADLEGVQGVRSNSPPGPNYFIFRGEFQEILCDFRETNPPFIHLNPLF